MCKQTVYARSSPYVTHLGNALRHFNYCMFDMKNKQKRDYERYKTKLQSWRSNGFIIGTLVIEIRERILYLCTFI